MLVKQASKENQNADNTSVDLFLTKEETQELLDTGFVVTDNGYCITMVDDEKLNYGGRK